jgi:hypothetical protein
MSTHISGFVVTLNDSITEEAADRVIAAISLLKGVVSVQPIKDSFELQLAREKVRREIGDQLFKEFKRILWGASDV